MFSYDRNDRDYPFYLRKDLVQESGNFWYHYHNERSDRAFAKYKMHVCINPAEFENVEEKLHDLLHRALADGVIVQYKTANVLDEKDKPREEDSFLRQLHSPFVVYFNDKYSEVELVKVVDLCANIERLLSDVKAGDINKRAICDLPLTPHLIFRQAYLNNDVAKRRYVNPFNTSKTDQLIKESKQSELYQKLISSPQLEIYASKARFLNAGERLVTVLKSYQSDLGEELDRIKKKYPEEGDKNALIICEQLEKLASNISSMQEIIKNYAVTEYLDQQSAELAFSKGIALLTAGASLGVEFSEEDKEQLFARRDTGKKRAIMGLFSKTDTEAHVSDITEEAKKALKKLSN